jgi:hypothetical protein
MTRTPWLLSIVALMAMELAYGASLQKGQMLYERGMLEEARHALVDVVTGDATNPEKAGALYLLGTIAVDQKNYPIAARMWSDLIQRFPDSTEAAEARTKLSSIPNGIQFAKVRVQSPHGTGNAPPEPFQGVLVTGTSAELRYAGQAVSAVASLLDSKGVTVAHSQSSTPGTISVLVLAMQFGTRDSLQAECYSRDGKLLWTEKVSGFLRRDKAAITAGLVEQLKSKIEPHVGDSCLPKS